MLNQNAECTCQLAMMLKDQAKVFSEIKCGESEISQYTNFTFLIDVTRHNDRGVRGQLLRNITLTP